MSLMPKITITNLNEKKIELEIYKILEVKEGKGGGFAFDLGYGVEGKDPEPCRKVIYEDFKGERKTVNTNESLVEIRKKIVESKEKEDFQKWIDSIFT